MATAESDKESFKRVLKEALAETLQEQRDLFLDVFAEVLEDFALADAIREGSETETVSRDEVFQTLRDGS